MNGVNLVRALAAKRLVEKMYPANLVKIEPFARDIYLKTIDELRLENGFVYGKDTNGLLWCVQVDGVCDLSLNVACLFGGETKARDVCFLLSSLETEILTAIEDEDGAFCDNFNNLFLCESAEIVGYVHKRLGSAFAERALRTGLIESIQIESTLECNDDGGTAKAYTLDFVESDLANEDSEKEAQAIELIEKTKGLLYGCESYLSLYEMDEINLENV